MPSSDHSVFRAVNIKDHRVAVCKMISITDTTTQKERKIIDKEMKVHSALKHRNVLEFLNAVVVEHKHRHHYIPGIYMLLEFAASGDLFDKIGKIQPQRPSFKCFNVKQHRTLVLAKKSRSFTFLNLSTE
jgi:serine/threonine protein kinase